MKNFFLTVILALCALSASAQTLVVYYSRSGQNYTSDGIVNLKDVTLLRRSIAGGWNVTVDANAADLNSDGNVNLKDVTLLRRFIAGGWGVTL